MNRRRMIAMMQSKADANRQPPSGVTISLHNPGVKLEMYLGRPTKTRKYRVKELDNATCSECTYDLPADWYLVNEETAGHFIVARQRETNRYVAVTRLSLVPMSEVHN